MKGEDHGIRSFLQQRLSFCLEADNQEQLFDQVATLLEEKKVVTDTYRSALIEREKNVPNRFRYGISREGLCQM